MQPSHAEILELHQQGLSMKAVGAKLGVSHTTVWRVVNGLAVEQQPKPCEGCGNPFVPYQPNHRYCSDRCRPWKQPQPPRTRACEHCSGVFTPLRNSQRFCSNSCRLAVWRKTNPKERERGLLRSRKKQRHHRRARKRGLPYEQVDSEVVFQRDGWRCGICGKKVNRRLKHPHPRSASLDHIIPISLSTADSGGHTYANTQCAHLVCNMKKHARLVPHQAALF